VTRLISSAALALFLTFIAGVRFAHAQPPPESPQPAADSATATASDQAEPADDHDDGRLRPIEPDYSLINLPTTLPLPLHAGNFHLTHRFNENLAKDDFGTMASNLFGLDEGATIDFEYRFGLFKHVELIASRTNVDRTIQLGTKIDPFHQSATMPFGMSVIVSVEGENNFSEQFAPALGAIFSHAFDDRLALYATPVWVHNTQAGTGTLRDTFYVGLGGRLKIIPTVYIVAEVTPRAGGYAPGDAEFAFSLEKRVGAHVFALTFANTSATSYAQLARGGLPDSLYLGFNLSRKFF
jgi:Membrane bound beta barrel domain (DUF5777)